MWFLTLYDSLTHCKHELKYISIAENAGLKSEHCFVCTKLRQNCVDVIFLQNRCPKVADYDDDDWLCFVVAGLFSCHSVLMILAFIVLRPMICTLMPLFNLLV